MEIVPPTGGELPPTPTPSPTGNRKIVCEYCKCQLTPNGEYLVLSDDAKRMRDQGETIARLKDELTAAAQLKATADRERDEARAALAAVTSPKVERGPFGR